MKPVSRFDLPADPIRVGEQCSQKKLVVMIKGQQVQTKLRDPCARLSETAPLTDQIILIPTHADLEASVPLTSAESAKI